METRHLRFDENLDFGDANSKEQFEKIIGLEDREFFANKDISKTKINPQPDGLSLKGKVVFKTPQGKILLIKNNLIVLRGRTLALEKLFDLDLDGTFPSDYIINRSRKICLFKVGTGGTLPDDPFNPIVVQYGERDLANPVPFRILVPDLGDAFVQDEAERYFGENTVTGGPDGDVLEYYFKRINISNEFKPEWEFDLNTNTVAVKMALKLDSLDVKDQLINELGLFAASVGVEAGTGNAVFSDPEMVSRITFDTEAMRGQKEILIDYYIFS